MVQPNISLPLDQKNSVGITFYEKNGPCWKFWACFFIGLIINDLFRAELRAPKVLDNFRNICNPNVSK